MQRHANSAAYTLRESERLHPLDLVARLEYLRKQAYATLDESQRHAILTAARRLRNGTPS